MLRIRFSDNEWQQLQEQAEAANLSMSALVRDHLGKVKIRNRADERARIVVLNRLNSNLNQIAKWANTHKAGAEAAEIIKELINLQQEIRGLE